MEILNVCIQNIIYKQHLYVLKCIQFLFLFFLIHFTPSTTKTEKTATIRQLLALSPHHIEGNMICLEKNLKLFLRNYAI